MTQPEAIWSCCQSSDLPEQLLASEKLGAGQFNSNGRTFHRRIGDRSYLPGNMGLTMINYIYLSMVENSCKSLNLLQRFSLIANFGIPILEIICLQISLFCCLIPSPFSQIAHTDTVDSVPSAYLVLKLRNKSNIKSISKIIYCTFLCVPSQNGLFLLWPQAQMKTESPKASTYKK